MENSLQSIGSLTQNPLPEEANANLFIGSGERIFPHVVFGLTNPLLHIQFNTEWCIPEKMLHIQNLIKIKKREYYSMFWFFKANIINYLIFETFPILSIKLS